MIIRKLINGELNESFIKKKKKKYKQRTNISTQKKHKEELIICGDVVSKYLKLFEFLFKLKLKSKNMLHKLSFIMAIALSRPGRKQCISTVLFL